MKDFINSRKLLLVVFVLSLMLLSFTLVSCAELIQSIELNTIFKDLSANIEKNTLDGFRLEIYHTPSSILEWASTISVDDLIKSDPEKYFVDSVTLTKYYDNFGYLNSDGLVLVKESSKLQARLCYIIFNEKNERLLEVAFCGFNNSIFVNGIEIEYDERFINFLKPFVPTEVLNWRFIYEK